MELNKFIYIFKNWEWEEIFIFAALNSWWLPILVALVTRHFYRRDHQRILAFAGFCLLMDHITDNDSLVGLFGDVNNNAPWYHLLSPGPFYLMTRFFADYLKDVGQAWLIWFLPVGFTLLVGVNIFIGDGLYVFPSKVVAVYSFTGIILAIGYFVYLLSSLKQFYLERQPMFWITTGLLLYFASTALVWLGSVYLINNYDLFWTIFRISHVATIFLNITFVVAIILDPPVNGSMANRPVT
jgi:hypothetical protein